MAKPANIKGQRFGKLVAVRMLAERDHCRSVQWFCRCDCGGSTIAAVRSLRSGNTKTCGCSWWDAAAAERTRKRSTTHGQYKSRTYRTWTAMLHRCRSTTKHPSNVKYYVDNGVAVCERWRSFENFLADMGPRPVGHSLDRYPNPEGNYEPKNCRWATPRQQRHNWRKDAKRRAR